MRQFLFITALLILSVSCKTEIAPDNVNATIPKVKAAENISKVLMAQQIAWNNGDIPSFMEGYWHSDDLIFVGRSGVTKGWQTTLENYKKGYPDKDAMGELTFEILELDSLSNDIYRMVGTFGLKRKEDNPSGIFTLIWRLINDKWLIVSDHTTG